MDRSLFDDVDRAWLVAKPGQKWRQPAGKLAAWVADMDFAPAAVITDALHEVIDGGDLGYPHWPYPHGGTPLARAFVERMTRRYGWQPDIEACRELADVTQGVRLVVHLASRGGDGIVLHTPAYPPFHATWRDMGRRLIEVPAHRGPQGWSFDYDDLERRLASQPGLAKIWVLCHPHNPTGHVFGRDELARIVDIAERHDLIIISDEIHAELVYLPSRHLPVAAVSDQAARRTVTLTSASKSFNVAGLRWAMAHVGPAALRGAIDTLPEHLLGVPNLMAVTAVGAAWTRGDEWLAACLSYLESQRRHLRDLLVTHCAAIDYSMPEATYLAWLDCRGLGLADEPYDHFARHGVELGRGPDFGPAGHGFVRLNFATSASMLTDIVAALGRAVPMR